jgi:uncharacterized protein YbjT (DUF2867 family)
MFAVNGITGKVGAAVARSLLSADQPVRAVVRDRSIDQATTTLVQRQRVARASNAPGGPGIQCTPSCPGGL